MNPKKYFNQDKDNEPLIDKDNKKTIYGTIKRKTADKQQCENCQRYEEYVRRKLTNDKEQR